MKKIILFASFCTLVILAGCKESWLDPKPLSFYTPENTYTDVAGLNAGLAACELQMRNEYYGEHAPILSEYYLTDVALCAQTDVAGCMVDCDNFVLPTTTNTDYHNKIKWYWEQGFQGVKYANIIISRIDNANIEDEETKNSILGAAYFHRAYWYYKLVHQFGDVPFIDHEITEPKLDFYTNDRWSILEKLKEDLEFSYKWVPENVDRGKTSKAACGVLLMKISMCLGDFDRAIELGKEIVANHPLMTQRFTSNQTKPNTNLMHDLHSVEAKLDPSNTEGLMYVVSYPNVEGSVRIQTMRYCSPYWAKGAAIKTPDGLTGTAISPATADLGSEIDNDYHYGRGIGTLRVSNYYQYDMWTEKDKNDLRSPNVPGSWVRMTDLYYNEPKLAGTSEWYGKHLVKPVNMSATDSTRCWYSWPYYKLWVPDPTVTKDRKGGETPWYIYRSAEVYLLLAECYYWKDQPQEEANMLNVVRARANADPLEASEVGIADILSERGRELYYEECRQIELARISYIYARTGHPCEEFGGTVYKLDQICGPGGTNSNVKQQGYNFWYDWVMKTNSYFRDNVELESGIYRISVHHMLWPIPEDAILSNSRGVINQNVGYPGTEKNITPLQVGEEAPTT